MPIRASALNTLFLYRASHLAGAVTASTAALGPAPCSQGGCRARHRPRTSGGTMAFPLVKQRKFFPLRACTSLLIQNILCMHTGARKVFTFRSVVAGLGCRAWLRLLPARAGAVLRESIAVTCNWGFALQPLFFLSCILTLL